MRKDRKIAASGIYHVMLRGVNKQDVFLSKGDFRLMQRALAEVQVRRDVSGEIVEEGLCVVYAYVIMNNHVHVLIKEGSQRLSEVMKRLQDFFVVSYNMKYGRVGPLFHGPFNSEPVDDERYFHQLLRYIHRNPVKSGDVAAPEEYEFSSWREYLELREDGICRISTVLRRFPLEELRVWVETPVDDECMDMESFRRRMSDTEAWELLRECSGCSSVEVFKQLSANEQIKFLKAIYKVGATLGQCSRLSIIPSKKIGRMIK